MEALVIALAKKYGMEKAIQLLGLDQQTQNPKYALNISGQNIDLMSMLKRTGLNQGIKSIMGSGKMGSMLSAAAPFALGAGAIYLLNKNREKLTGFKTQAAYEANLNQRRANSRLDKITDRLTSGKDYGNYEEALLGSDAGAVKIDDTVMHSSDYFPEPIKPAPAPVTVYHGGGNDSGGGSSQDNAGGGASANRGDAGSGWDSSPFARGGRARYGRGGIASL